MAQKLESPIYKIFRLSDRKWCSGNYPRAEFGPAGKSWNTIPYLRNYLKMLDEESRDDMVINCQLVMYLPCNVVTNVNMSAKCPDLDELFGDKND